MIKSITATGIHQRISVSKEFHDDLNIITGSNGCGKTTLLKLVWYLVSANIERVFQEIYFDFIHLQTEKFYIKITCNGEGLDRQAIIEHDIPGAPSVSNAVSALRNEPEGLKLLNKESVRLFGASVYFPTFRRIEGGYGLMARRAKISHRSLSADQGMRASLYSASSDLGRALKDLSDALSVHKSTFVSSLSSEDIDEMIDSRFAQVSRSSNELLEEIGRSIADLVKQGEGGNRQPDSILHSITTTIRTMEKRRELLYRPLDALTELISELFASKSVRIGEAKVIGDEQTAIRSDRLSAGEKQLLSFLTYNALFDNACIFIDEPEISLHVDWQRRLCAVLQEQNSTNQFFMATHSPFIYNKYADKEIALASDRGD